jgi:hypothetical protein
MSTHCIFKLEGRRYGSGHATYAQIVCGYCDHTEWHIARDSGVAIRVFRSAGWKVGNKDKQHRCPACFSKIKSARRTPDNPAIPKEIGKQLKEKIVSAHLKDALMNGSILHPGGVIDMPLLPGDERPAIEKAIDGIHPVPPRPRATPGTPSVPGKTTFGTRHNASQAGTRATGSTDGHAFYTVPLGAGWTWKLAVNTTEAERTHWRATRKYGPRKPVEKKAQRLHGAIVQPEKDPMTHTTAPTADRQPTRDERSSIHDELTKTYDIVQQRYAGNDSDANVAGRLDLPRAWVTDLRTMFFGDFDRNQQSEAKLKVLDEATVFAENAMTELLEMAQRAEQLVSGLRAARKKMEG